MANQSILFVCLHGSAKSVIAAEHLRRMAGARGVSIDVTAAGTEPDAAIPPHVVAGLARDGIDVGGQRPHGVTRDDVRRASQIVTFGCDVSRLAPANPRIHAWDDVPAVSENFDKARDVIVARLSRLLDECAKA